MDNIGLFKNDKAVAIGMRVRNMLRADCIAVNMKSDIFGKSNNEQAFLGNGRPFHLKRLDKGAQFYRVTHIIIREDQGAFFTQLFVAASVVTVIMGINQQVGV
jgi:hypothetical protein